MDNGRFNAPALQAHLNAEADGTVQEQRPAGVLGQIVARRQGLEAQRPVVVNPRVVGVDKGSVKGDHMVICVREGDRVLGMQMASANKPSEPEGMQVGTAGDEKAKMAACSEQVRNIVAPPPDQPHKGYYGLGRIAGANAERSRRSTLDKPLLFALEEAQRTVEGLQIELANFRAWVKSGPVDRMTVGDIERMHNLLRIVEALRS